MYKCLNSPHSSEIQSVSEFIMTTLGSSEITCAICAETSEHTIIGSTSSFGSPDLDLRPPEMKRSTMAYWLQECPDCGYSAGSIDDPHPNAKDVMASDAFQTLQTGPLGGTLTGRFLKASLFDEASNDLSSAADHALCAAWAADDAKDVEGAIQHRNRSANLFLKTLDGADSISEETIVTKTRLVDILRRATRWDEANEIALELLKQDMDQTIRSVITFGQAAINSQDDQAHTVAQAMGDD
jgi:hypothetical protein